MMHTSRKTRQWTAVEKEEVLRRYLAGESCVILAKAYDISPTTVGNLLKKRGLLSRTLSEASAKRKFPKQRWNEVVRLYEEGKTPLQIGLELELHKSGVRYILQNSNVCLRGKGYFHKPLRKISEEQKQELCVRYVAGEHLRPLAEEFGTNQKGLTAYLKSQGVQIRPSQSQINKELATKGELGKIMSCKIRGIPLEEFDGFSKPERNRFMGTDEYKHWRFSVFTRDAFACQICGCTKGGTLQAHHIRRYADYPDLRVEVSNGITLCKICHEADKGKEEERAPFYESLVEDISGGMSSIL